MIKILSEWWIEKNEEDNLNKLIKQSDDILRNKEISINEDCFKSQEGMMFDPDSSPIAWLYYREMYEWIRPSIKVYLAGKRIYGCFNYDEKIEDKIEHVDCADKGYYKYIDFAGDCVFNFKEGGKTNYKQKDGNYRFDAIVETCMYKDEKENLKKKLQLCKRMQHSPYNFALIPKTGGMNNRKRQDRPDWLLTGIDNLYSADSKDINLKNLDGMVGDSESERVLKEMIETKDKIYELQGKYKVITYRKNSWNDVILYNFLIKLGSVKEYAKLFYHLDDNDKCDVDDKKTMLESMIEFGNEAINSYKKLEKYMNLAICYWNIQRKKYNRLEE